jgi:hypothetical protein
MQIQVYANYLHTVPTEPNLTESKPRAHQERACWVRSGFTKCTRREPRGNPYGIAVDTAKAVDTAIALQFY